MEELKQWAEDWQVERELMFLLANAKTEWTAEDIKKALSNDPYIFEADRMIEFLDECDLKDRETWEAMDYEEAVDYATDTLNWIEWIDAQGCTLYAPDYWEEATRELT